MVRALKWSLLVSVVITTAVISFASLAHQLGWDPAVRHSEEHALTIFGHQITGAFNVQPVEAPGDGIEELFGERPKLTPGTRVECVVVQ